MAEVLRGGEWIEPFELVSLLRDALPDEYCIVASTAGQGRPFDTVVIGPQGLFLLYARTWEGIIFPASRGAWRQELLTGDQQQLNEPPSQISAAKASIRALLRDSFPRLKPNIYHIFVLTNPSARLDAFTKTEPTVVRQENVADAILGTPVSKSKLDAEVRQALALALRDWQLAPNQRATEPFVFRSGTILGRGKRAWTLREAVKHMDRFPDDGVFHLRDGTLAQWLASQGADDLAELARRVSQLRESNPRISLETFLIGTGLVKRPRIDIRPRRLKLGCVVAGERCSCRLRIRQGAGRGYLFGSLKSSVPWLRVEPRAFAGKSTSVRATVQSGGLSISPTPWRGEIEVETSAAEEPILIPVQVRIVGSPSALDHYLLRPLFGLALSGVLGLLLGWALAGSGVPQPVWFDALSNNISWSTGLLLVVTIVWAVLGLVRGFLQPPHHPTLLAAGRWLLRTTLWGATLCILAAAGHWIWNYFRGTMGVSPSAISAVSIILLSLVPAPLLSIIGEARTGQKMRSDRTRSFRRWVYRPAVTLIIGIILCLTLLLGQQALMPSVVQVSTEVDLSQMHGWLATQWLQLETTLQHWVDQRYLEQHDRRAPLETPTAAASPQGQESDD